MYSQLNSAPRAPNQSKSPRDRITSADAQPRPAVISLLCPLPGMRDKTTDNPSRSATSTLLLRNSYKIENALSSNIVIQLLWNMVINEFIEYTRQVNWSLRWHSWLNRGKMWPTRAFCTAAWIHRCLRLECISKMLHIRTCKDVNEQFYYSHVPTMTTWKGEFAAMHSAESAYDIDEWNYLSMHLLTGQNIYRSNSMAHRRVQCNYQNGTESFLRPNKNSILIGWLN